MNWNNVGLVLAGPGLVQGLAHKVLRLNAHVELWLVLGLVEVAFKDVIAGPRHLHPVHHILPLRVANRILLQIIGPVQARIFWVVGQGSDVAGLFHFLNILSITLGFISVLNYFEAGNGKLFLLIISIGPRRILLHFIIRLKCATQN